MFLVPAAAAEPYLAPRNTEVPFPYLPGETRTWPILTQPMPAGGRMTFVAKLNREEAAQGNVIEVPGFRIDLANDRLLRVQSTGDAPDTVFQLEISLALPGGALEYQTITLQPGPPPHPLSYLADFGDDLIRIFQAPDGTWQPVTRDAFDQYFRRCQIHGVTRMILWLGPMPLVVDPDNYAPEDWARYEAQARALNESPAFQTLVRERLAGAEDGHWGRHLPWDWIRQIKYRTCTVSCQKRN